jgi:hypothetical protein
MYSIKFHLVLVSAFPQSHSFLELCMLHLGVWLRENIGRIVGCVYVGVVDYLASMEISTVLVAQVDMFRSGLDHSGGEMCESSMIVTVDR